MKKQAVETACRKAGMAPARRCTVRGVEVFIADGFSSEPHLSFQRFGVEQGEFPNGVYATLWWAAKDDDLDVGQPLFFDPMHNPEYDLKTKKMARVNSAIQEASKFLKRRKEMSRDA